MRFKLSRVGAAALGAIAAAALSPVVAQERIEITGSAIKRVEAEGALPVQIIKREEIERTGATSVTDLIQRLPGMQGATSEAASVGGGGGGFAGASIHNIGETRTLVLLNGRRLAQFGGQSLTGFGAAIDLNTLPLSSIERVEILTDGASALYGSDAVAGVVNFITRRNTTEGNISAGYSDPKGTGASETRVSLSKGFGDLQKDGFSVFATVSADKRKPLNAVDREVSKSGVINFDQGGKKYQAFLGSPSSIPGNVLDDAGDIVSPYYLKNGSCPSGSVATQPGTPGKVACYFDFVAQLEIFPERDRKNLMISGDVKLGENHTLFADLLISKTTSTGIIAPVPGSVSIPLSSPLYGTYLTPLSGTNGSTFTADTVAFYRVYDLGRRADENISKFKNLVVGAKGTLFDFDYEAAVTYSKNDFVNNISGYPGALALSNLRASGLLNPFVGPGEQPQASLDAIRSIVYKGYWDGGTSELTSYDARVSKALMDLAGGPLAVAAGVNYYTEKFQGKPSLFAQAKLTNPVTGELCDPNDPAKPCDQRFGDSSAAVPYGADRSVGGIFAEVSMPLAKGLEVTAAARYDKYEEVGSTTNGKLSVRFQPMSSLLLRGSIGTGFKAPTVPQLKAAPQSFGVTSSPYDCTPELAAVAAAVGGRCQPNGRQYDVVAGGNDSLKPEKSKQGTLGVVFEPMRGVSMSADWWWVGIRDVFGQISQAEAFANPGKYPGSWTTALDIATGINYLAYNQANLNLGKAYYSGIDFKVDGRTATPFGELIGEASATYMLRDREQVSPGGEYFNPIGANEPSLQFVTFGLQANVRVGLKTGAFTNQLGFNFKSGYKDVPADVEVLNADGTNSGTFETIQLDVPSYITWDWQTQWQVAKGFTMTFGVLNLFDRKPPLTLAQGGAGKGQMFGYDDRYTDVRGRTLYINGSFSF